MIYEDTIESDELFLNPGWFSAREETFYRLEKTETTFSAVNPNAIFALGVVSSTTSMSHSRSIYNFLDFLGDIGGLLDALKLIAGAFLSLLG